MLKIGLTGGIGCGKSTVAKYFAELGITVIDADSIVHELQKPGTTAFKRIVEHFGDKILTGSSAIDRNHLRKLILQNSQEKQWLEELLHPLVYAEMAKRCEKAQSSYCILVIPLLLETKQQDFVDRILVIDTTEKQQISRTLARGDIPLEEVKAMIASQVTRQERLAAADDVLYNEGSLFTLRHRITALHRKYLALSKMNN